MRKSLDKSCHSFKDFHDYVPRRFNASLAELGSLGAEFSLEPPLDAISKSGWNSEPSEVSHFLEGLSLQ